MKNIASKSRKSDNPYAQWTDVRTGWEYKLLKSWQGDNSKPFSRWFVEVRGWGHDMGDEYVENLLQGMPSAGLKFDTSIWPTLKDFVEWAGRGRW
jgi:hypothetical protein